MQKEYKPDDEFKRWARALQFAYREEVLKDFNEEKAPQVLLSDKNAKQGLIFYERFRDLILSKDKVGHVSNIMTNNMLRSEHIPYNMFTPLETMPELAKDVFSAIIGFPIKEVQIPIKIEYAGKKGKKIYLEDGTSFDAFVEYVTYDGKHGALGIEVKYTENEYRLGVTEEKAIKGEEDDPEIQRKNELYRKMTAESGYFVKDLDIRMFLKAHHLRQIWRNHILGYSMKNNGEYDLIYHMHLYPKNNAHFQKHALPDYRKILTEVGLESFKAVTYEDYIALLEKFSDDEKVRDWVKYLRARYLGL